MKQIRYVWGIPGTRGGGGVPVDFHSLIFNHSKLGIPFTLAAHYFRETLPEVFVRAGPGGT